MQLSPDTLAGRVWTFRQEGAEPFARALVLHPDGSVGNFSASNEASWWLEDGLVCFGNARGAVTTKFSCVHLRDDGTLLLRGRFRLEPRREVWFELDEHTTPLGDILGCFESLGDNCEFGFVQRYFGVEPLGLLRFNWIEMNRLLLGLETGFHHLERPDNLSVKTDQAGEYIVHDRTYGFAYHTERYAGQTTEEELLRGETTRLTFLKRKLLEDLQDGEKIFVRKGHDSRDLDQVIPLYERMRDLGPATLLWVVATDEESRAGSVEQIDDGLLRGHVRRFAKYTFAREIAADSWGRLCKAAYARTFAVELGAAA